MLDPCAAADRIRTRAAYDQVAESYAEVLAGQLDGSSWERDALGGLARRVLADGGGPVADLGCGTGRTLGFLAGHGLELVGIDLSVGMLRVARRDHPAVGLAQGDLTALPIPDDTLAGAVVWYSIIHLLAADRPVAAAELHRVVRPGGHVLVSFQVGGEVAHLTQAYGHDGLDYDAHRLDPDQVAADLVAAGLDLLDRSVRPAEADERNPQAWLLARRPTGSR